MQMVVHQQRRVQIRQLDKLDSIGSKPIYLVALGQCEWVRILSQLMPSIVTSASGIVTTYNRVLIC